MDDIRSHANVEDYRRLMSVVSLFRDGFSIDWLLDLMIGKKTSQILAQLDQGMKEGWLERSQPGHYNFVDPKNQEEWKGQRKGGVLPP